MSFHIKNHSQWFLSLCPIYCVNEDPGLVINHRAPDRVQALDSELPRFISRVTLVGTL